MINFELRLVILIVATYDIIKFKDIISFFELKKNRPVEIKLIITSFKSIFYNYLFTFEFDVYVIIHRSVT